MHISVKGNKKLINDENLRFMIWSLPPIITCPNRTANCSTKCYALKSQRLYPNTKKSRAENFEYSQRDSFVEIMSYEIEKMKKSKAFQNKKIYFRIHESGDFYNKIYWKKWLEIVQRHKDITFACYTKSFDIIGDDIDNIPDNFIIRASIWNDTKQADRDYIQKHGLPVFTTVDEIGVTADDVHVCGGSCGESCLKCYTKHKNIVIKIH